MTRGKDVLRIAYSVLQIRNTQYAIRFTLLLLLLLIGRHQPAAAQEDSAAYWRYDAPGRLDLVLPADVNQDGIDEFVVMAEGVNVTLVGSDGQGEWPSAYETTETILQLTTANVDGTTGDDREIVLGTESQLILLTSGGRELWQKPMAAAVGLLTPFDHDHNGLDEILVGLQSGLLQLYSAEGTLLWHYEVADSIVGDAQPKAQVGDLDGDGEVEIAFTYFIPRQEGQDGISQGGFSKLLVLNRLGAERWALGPRPIGGRVTALTLAQLDPQGEPAIALGTSLHRVYLFNGNGDQLWYRTPNKPVTSLLAAQLQDGPALVVGTAVGTVLAYNEEGKRYWSQQLSATPNRPIVALSGSQRINKEDRLLAILGTEAGSTAPSDAFLLDSDGRILERFPSADTNGLTRLVDINDDGYSELLLVTFATLELVDPGVGVREYSPAWNYRLQALPESALVVDLDRDGRDELLIGTNDGRLLLLQSGATAPQWEQALGGPVTQLAVADSGPEGQKLIAVVHNNRILSEDGVESFEGWLRLLRPADGQQVLQIPLPTTITSLLMSDINSNLRPEILIGTADGQIITYSMDGREVWRSAVNGSVNHLVLVQGDRGTEVIVGSRANEIDRFNNKGTGPVRAAAYLQEIASLYSINQPGEIAAQILVAVEDGTVRGLNWRGIQLWELNQETIAGLPTLTLPADNSFLVATDESELLRLDYDGNILWQQNELGRITSLYWGDLNEDGRPDVAVGNREGRINLLPEDGSLPWATLEPASSSDIFYLTTLRSGPDGPADLVAITNNGLVQSFRSQPNRPPLLINPRTDVIEGSYTINVTVIDLEQDQVQVTLDLFDVGLGRWVPQQMKTASNGREELTWPVNVGEGVQSVRYEFFYEDEFYQGHVEPAVGPPPIVPNPFFNSGTLTIFAVIGAVGVTVFLAVRQGSSPASNVRRFYQRLNEHPELTLDLVEAEYNRTSGSPDFLLNLANRARQNNDLMVASLADGLFLLAVRAAAALPIIKHALEEAEEVEPNWHHLQFWQMSYQVGQSLLEAPSMTELSLLRPQLVYLLALQNKDGRPASNMNELLPILTSLRDSERVDLAEDRLVYLNEAAGLLRQLEGQLVGKALRLDDALVRSLVGRWLGLVNAEIEELRGRAKIVVNLKTQQLVPAKECVVALEIKNSGRAPAEHIVITLENDPAYQVLSPAEIIPYLPAGRTRLVTFTIDPQTADRFRVAFTIQYDDRHGRDKALAFADMVHVLPPVRDFSPIANPYSPGMPLRRKSQMFYGREDLFEFIVQNAGHLTQQNVLILVGQRRTGKTSALLQLEQHLPDHLLPIYIDCQSLGVTPGMPALFHDIAWAMADALNARGYELNVPEPADWQEDPTGLFQRRFIPAARASLPSGTLMLMIFDEFEAFENLVNDGILPATLFTYLRHLMQHGEGLSFVFVGTRRLEEMSTDYWSVLFNIALYRQIGFLTEPAAIRLIREPVSPHVIYDDLAIDKILRVTAGHPYFLQLVCYTLVNRANQRRSAYVTISDVNAGLEEMLRLGEMHFAYMWQRSTHAERALLAAIAHLMDRDAPLRPSDLVQYLAEYGVHLNPAEVTAGLTRLVEREILNEVSDEAITLYELKIGLIGLWAAQNKSLNKLYDGRSSRREREKEAVRS